MSYLSTHSQDLEKPRFNGHVWRSEDGKVNATVEVTRQAGDVWYCFDDPSHARALAAECIKAAEAMERFEAESVTSSPATPEEE
jgi:hypothetical protein